MKTKIPLTQIPIAEPCSKDWNAMTGDALTRFCDGCQKHVHNLSAMTVSEAEHLVCSAAGRMCVRYEFNTDGSVKTLDYAPVEGPKHGWKFWALVGGGLATLISGAQAVTTKAPLAPPAVAGGIRPPRVVVMGDMVAPAMLPATQPADAIIGKPCVPAPNVPETLSPVTNPAD